MAILDDTMTNPRMPFFSGHGFASSILLSLVFVSSMMAVHSWTTPTRESSLQGLVIHETTKSTFDCSKAVTSRRTWMKTNLAQKPAAALLGVIVGGGGSFLAADTAQAAPPISVIAEELGYFPVYNKAGDVVYIPKRIKRSSTEQAIELAKQLQSKNIVMFGTYWCPHCARQKEVFGKEAFQYLTYVECSPKGYGYKAGLCPSDVEGYPTFRDVSRGGRKSKGLLDHSGEWSLEALASQAGFTSFDPSLEDGVPLLGTACKLPARQ
jgi:hypothetical protein